MSNAATFDTGTVSIVKLIPGRLYIANYDIVGRRPSEIPKDETRETFDHSQDIVVEAETVLCVTDVRRMPSQNDKAFDRLYYVTFLSGEEGKLLTSVFSTIDLPDDWFRELTKECFHDR